MLENATGTSLWQWLDGRDTARMNRYRRYLAFYEGDQWDERRRAGERRLTVNYARSLVRKSASYLMPRPVAFDVRDAPSLALPRTRGRGQDQNGGRGVAPAFLPSLDAAGRTGAGSGSATLAETALAEAYLALDLHTLDFQSAVDSAVLGDGAFKVTWNGVERRPVVAAVDPQGIWAWWRPDDPSVLTRVVQRYEIGREDAALMFGGKTGSRGTPGAGNSEGSALPVPANGHLQTTTSSMAKVVEDWTAEWWRVEVDGAVVRDEANPYGWIPFVIYPNLARPHEVWGASDLEDLVEVCRELNRRMTTLSRILEVAGYPITVLENVNGSEGIRVDAGAVWELPEASRAYLLDMLSGGGVGLHIDYLNLLYRQLHDLSETPRTAFGDSGRSLSGVALEVEIQPLVQKVMRKRRTWDMVYRKRNAMMLDLLERFGGLDLGGLRQTQAVWSEVLPSDREALVRSEARLVESGIHSRRDAMAVLGDADAEATWERVLAEMEELGTREQETGKSEEG